MALYTEKVMDHFRNPRNVGFIPDADGVGEVGNAKCGDIMKIYLKIENEIINNYKVKAVQLGEMDVDPFCSTESFTIKSSAALAFGKSM